MAAGSYKRLISVLDRWPIDQNKAGRDFGQHLRDFVNKANKTGHLQKDPQYWDRQYMSLQRLVNNEHLKKFPRHLTASATGLNAEQCNLVLSNEFLEHLEQEEESIFKRLFTSKKKQQ